MSDNQSSHGAVRAVALVSVVAVLGAGFGLWSSVRSRPTEVIAGLGAPEPQPADGPSIFVHVAGAVHTPGVYRLTDGSRGDDAVRAAGGATPDADLDAVNLAAPLMDGDKLLIPRRANDPVGVKALLNLNTATAAQLATLPGVGPATAERIIAYREEIGGFRKLEQLLDVPGIGDTKFSQISPHVTV